MVQYDAISHAALWWLKLYLKQNLYSQETPPYLAPHGELWGVCWNFIMLYRHRTVFGTSTWSSLCLQMQRVAAVWCLYVLVNWAITQTNDDLLSIRQYQNKASRAIHLW